MNRKIYPYSIALAMAMLTKSNPYYSMGHSKHFITEEQRKQYDNYQKEHNHRLNPVNLTEHEFIINGEKIMAKNRKTALKIYARHHQNKKK